MEKVLVTGGSGFIGSHMIRELINRNYEVAITTKYDSVHSDLASCVDPIFQLFLCGLEPL